jgi:hypothetical protein
VAAAHSISYALALRIRRLTSDDNLAVSAADLNPA